MEILLRYWPYITGLVSLINIGVAICASTHVVTNKRDSRAAIGWVGIIWLTPLIGSLLYVLLGINRIQRRAVSRRSTLVENVEYELGAEQLELLPDSLDAPYLNSLVHLVGQLTNRPLMYANQVTILRNGDQAYPEMIEAIESAEKSVTFASYIFDNDRSGQVFVEALARAHRRGIGVRVLIDDVGARYSWPTVSRLLEQHNVPTERFMRTLVPWRFQYFNLRSHRKLMVVDGRIGFTGGMNIREGHDLRLSPDYPIQDLHFRVEGPVVHQIQNTFALDWAFTTEEVLSGAQWWAPIEPCAEPGLLARGIPDGPDEDYDKLRLTILGAIACSKKSVQILTPYFVPDSSVLTSLSVAALRGIQVDLVVPAQNNLRMVQWASTATLRELVDRGCRIWLSPPPFDHSKVMVVDEVWSVVGSANWDARSLRLNFEFNLECYDRGFATQLSDLIKSKIEVAQPVSAEMLDNRPFIAKVRDGAASLLSPYL